MANPLVSIIIPVYNYGKFIRDALESILRQTYPAQRMEIIVVDDGSTDDTGRIVGAYGEQVQYYYQENSGIARARNVGVLHAKGDIITFLDADDVWKDRRIEKVVEQFESKPDIGFVYHPVALINEDGVTLHEDFCTLFGYQTDCRGWIANLIFSGKVFCGGSSFAFKKEILSKVWPVEEGIKQGIDYYITALVSCLSLGEPLPDVLGSYRLHDYNTTLFRGQKDSGVLALINYNFACLREKVIEKIESLTLPPDQSPDLGIIKRKYAKEMLFYNLLSGKRSEAIRYIPMLFRGTMTFHEFLQGVMYSTAVCMPVSLCMRCIGLTRKLLKPGLL